MTPDAPGTRERLLAAATELFAHSGFRGASVRDICDRARANSGAVSYHFGGKRQLYRIVLRRSVEAAAEAVGRAAAREHDTTARARVAVRELLNVLETDPALLRLVTHDLAEGGEVAAESLVPPLRAAYDAVRDGLGPSDDPGAAREARAVLLGLCAPVLLVAVAWPVLERVLEPPTGSRRQILEELLDAVRHGDRNSERSED